MADDPLDLMAQGWDAGYASALQVFEAGLFRVATMGARGIDGMSKPNNPYRRNTPASPAPDLED